MPRDIPVDNGKLLVCFDSEYRIRDLYFPHVGGMARYKKDYCHRVSARYPGNPWFICTLWFADYLADKATNDQELQKAINILNWVTEHALSSGVLAGTGRSCHGQSSICVSAHLEPRDLCCHNPESGTGDDQIQGSTRI